MGVAAAVVAVGVVGAVATTVAAGQQASAIKSAASTQANADLQAQQLQSNEFQQTQANLQPFVNQGSSAFNQLGNLTGANPGQNPLTSPLTTPFNPTMASLAATPGYQFALTQGQQAVTNSNAAQGLGSSGAALKGAANYAEGLAGTQYQQQFQNYLSQNQQIYNMLSGEANTGESAAAQEGTLGQQNVNAQNADVTGAGAAQAAGTTGAAQVQANAINSIAANAQQSVLGYALTQGSSNNGLYNSTGGVQQPNSNAFLQ